MSPKRTAAGSVDEYLAAAPQGARASLEKLRKTIKAAAPQATEGISYQIPAYKHLGMLVSFAAFENHCSFYVMSPSVMQAHTADLTGYEVTKGGIHFTPDQPLPARLVTKLVKARIAENEKRKKKK